ncbi:MAG: hypothetical protein PVH68_17205 [Armatimonadota bacterium]
MPCVIRSPGDKTLSHVALVLAGLSSGPVDLVNLRVAEDTRGTARALRQLGVRVGRLRRGGVAVRGRRWVPPSRSIPCGSSTSTARLLLGALAGLPARTRLTGGHRLRGAAMSAAALPLRAMGASVDLGPDGGLPVTVHGGRLRSLSFHVQDGGSQTKTALLLAALHGGVPVLLTESPPTRDHAERLMRHLRLPVRLGPGRVRLDDGPTRRRRLPGWRLVVPGDPTLGAYLIAGAALGASCEVRIERLCLNRRRAGFLDVMRRMGVACAVQGGRWSGGERVGNVVVSRSPMRAARTGAEEARALADELPALAVLAARATGQSRFAGIAGLRGWTPARLGRLVRALRDVGADATEADGGLVVHGTTRPAGVVDVGDDAALAMAFTALAAASGADMTVRCAPAARREYRSYESALRRMRADA